MAGDVDLVEAGVGEQAAGLLLGVELGLAECSFKMLSRRPLTGGSAPGQALWLRAKHHPRSLSLTPTLQVQRDERSRRRRREHCCTRGHCPGRERVPGHHLVEYLHGKGGVARGRVALGGEVAGAHREEPPAELGRSGDIVGVDAEDPKHGRGGDGGG